jgi:hypothetical protein
VLLTKVTIERLSTIAFASSLTFAGVISLAQSAPLAIGIFILAAALLHVALRQTAVSSHRLQPIRIDHSQDRRCT